MEELLGAAESGGCARGYVTSSNPSAWPWLRCCTTRTTRCTPSTALHGARTATRARGGGESDEKKYTAKFRKTPPPQAIFQLYDEEDAVWGLRPGSVFDPVPQGRVERHVVEHRIETCPFVQILDAPVPQLGNQVLELLQKIVTSSFVEPVQVIEVPKIFPDRVPQRIVERRPPQTAEQLVEVPTIISYSSLLQRTDQLIVDIPVPGRGGGGRGGFQGSHPGQSSTAGVAEQFVEIPGRGDPHGFLPRQSTLQRTVEQFVDIPVPAGGGLHGIRLDPGGPSSSAVLRHERGHRDLRTFAHGVKSARSAGSSSARVHPHSSSWTLAAY